MKNNQATTMSVSLPKNLKDYVRQRTKQESFGTPSDYIRGLIRDDVKRHQQERLEKMLLEGIASGSSLPMTAKEWKRLNAELGSRIKSRR